jgi:hypothetical protein
MQIIHSIITFILVYLTIYSYGFAISNKIYKRQEQDIFFTILIGYCVVGAITLILHFFFKINNFISIFFIASSSIIFYYFRHKINIKKNFLYILIILIFSFFLFGYSDHPIDTNMYHHPYVSYLKSEKIIFAIANIQFRFGHISFLQYVQSALSNDYLHEISLASINIVFYICFIIFISEKIINTKKFNYNFLIDILFASFLLIKLARYREYGNDLIPLLVSIYFLIQILEVNKNKLFTNNNLMNFAFPFMAFMFVHKISYTFAVLMFLPLFNFTNLKFLSEINIKYLFVVLVIFIPWLIKNYITTSCFAYPVEISCISNTLYTLSGLADPSKASWLSELWAKAFIAHPNWKEIDLNIYMSGLNWFPTWLGSHFVKILEIMSPLFFMIFIITFFLFFKNNNFLIKRKSKNNSSKYLVILSAILIGLSIWFYKAPTFRYGSFYIISFVVLAYISILDFFFKEKNSTHLKFFKVTLLVCLFFFVAKNSLRIYKSETGLFPKTVFEKNERNFNKGNDDGLQLLKPHKGVCYYTKLVCSHEIPKNIRIIKLGSYFMLLQ